MILMMRMHLINWHNFEDDIIDFRNMTYLIGLNAVGKTTIMDAIRYCLTTNKDFNTAGNRKSARSLQGSVHQKQRAEDSYLRPNHTVAYIGIEFLDESKNDRFVISVRVESESPKQELRHVSQDWYISKLGSGLEDMPYFTMMDKGKRPSAREEFKLPDKGLNRAPSQTEAKRRICRILGIGDADSNLGKKFNEVFHMGTSLEDINDIRKFIYTYILPEPEIDVEVLHSDMRELERLQEILEDALIRERLLNDIMDKMSDAKELNGKVKVNEALVSYAKVQDAKEKQKVNLMKVKNAKHMLEHFDLLLNELNNKKDEAEKLYIDASNEKKNNKENTALDFLTQGFNNKMKEYDTYIKEAKKFEDAYENLVCLSKMFMNMEMSFDIDISVIGNAEMILDVRKNVINNCRQMINELDDVIREGESIVRNHKREINNEILELTKKIKILESGNMCYPEEAELVRKSINEKFKELGIEEEAKIFSELLYMNDIEWQNAVESYLNNQRFNIIIAPKYYEIAKEVFIKLRDQVRSVGLVDTVRLSQRNRKAMDTNVSWLSQKVESKNTYAKQYSDFLMDGVVCCDDETELEQHHRSVTKDLLRYQNYCLQRMRTKDRYIGMDALQLQLKSAKIELQYNYNEQKLCDEKIIEYKKLGEKYQQFIVGTAMNDLNDNLEAKKKSEKLYDDISAISDQIEEYKKNPILRAMFNKIENCKKKYDEILEEITSIKGQKNGVNDTIKNADMSIKSLQINIDEAQKEYDKIIASHAQYIQSVKEKYKEERKTKEAAAIVYNFSNRINQDNSAFNKYVNSELLPLQRQYSSTYACDYQEGLEGDSQYQVAYNSLVNIDLEYHRDALNKAQIRCKERFRKEILFRMKDDILHAKQQFRQLNKVMENLPYGEESYKFSIDGSKDKELNIFYNIIMDKNNQQIEEDNQISMFLNVDQSEVFESQIEEFMQRIMVDVENQADKNLTGKKNSTKEISMYVDYRSYLDYDITVKNSVTGLEVPLSKVSGDSSGGENQAPFYVAICASFLQIYEQNENCIRLVLLDEAFNKMTSDRIEPMMKMFRNLKLQVVLISTVEKCSSIFPYCDITYSIVKSGSRNAIAAFEGI